MLNQEQVGAIVLSSEVSLKDQQLVWLVQAFRMTGHYFALMKDPLAEFGELSSKLQTATWSRLSSDKNFNQHKENAPCL